MNLCLFFFFQAEDGIRDVAVTGVQTCALPISWHVTIAPSWFDPSTAPPQITPFGILYALHDALVRPYPGQKMGPSLAESWRESPDGKTHQVRLRAGPRFHNRDPLTPEAVRVSFGPYKGARGNDPP